jgi:DNA-binding Xre family transcriptional regulator
MKTTKADTPNDLMNWIAEGVARPNGGSSAPVPGSPLKARINALESELAKLKKANRARSDTTTGMGRALRTLREQRALTLSQVAANAGITKGLLSDLEQGKRCNATWATLKALARALCVTPAQLASEITDEENSELNERPLV